MIARGFAALAALLIGESYATALPMFARKLGVSCAFCHTTPPRLNETGYRFRAAGFRLPTMIGKDDKQPFRLFDYNSVRVQGRYSASRSQTAPATKTVNELKFQALELYPFTGAWGKYLSSNIKLTFSPGRDPDIENAYLRVNAGKRESFFVARAGIFHPFDGYGASDSPATISRPLIQTTPANFDQTTFFRPWGFDQLGAEIGFDYHRTSVRASFLNGIVLHQEDGRLAAFAAQGGPLTRSSPLPAHDFSDFQVFINHTLHREGGGISLHYYRGNLALPITVGNSSFRNTFDRTAIYGSYPAAKRLHLLVGLQRGRDLTAAGGRFASEGIFAEAVVPITTLTAAGTRYDWFDPARQRPNNEIRAITAYLNAWFFRQFRIVAEYQYKYAKLGLYAAQKDDALQVRFIFIK